MKRASRFSVQPKGAYGSVAPPCFGGGAVASAMTSSTSIASTSKPAKDYFDDDDDDDTSHSAYQAGNTSQGCYSVPGDYDPLDDFMANIEVQVKQQAAAPVSSEARLPEIVSGLDEDDDFGTSSGGGRSANNSNTAGKSATAEDLDELEGYLNGTATGAPDGKTRIDPLPPVDHSSISYSPFRKAFYTEHKEIAGLSSLEVDIYRDSLDLHVTPHSAPRPLKTFAQAGFDSRLLAEIGAAGYEMPTAIQAQAVPIAMSGYDLIGLAKTGSGKTLAYLWPMIVHILAQPQMQVGDGPIALVLAPTRELAAQIHTEARKFATKVYNIRAVAVYGGGGKWEMSKALKEECPEIVIATPGRFIEMVRNKSTNLRRCTLVVLDEADRMFEMGFEYQMLSIVNNIRPDRQVLMFSATMKRKIESFARNILRNEVKVVVGKPGQANADIAQKVELFGHESEKLGWLRANIDEFAADGKVLIFVLSKAGTEEVTFELKKWFQRRQLQINVDCLHGDKDQSLRTKIMHNFTRNSERNDALTILVATDIAARGLDVKDIRTVINYDVAKNIETYVHRIGRTGRMGVEGVTPGTAYTLLTPKDSSFAVDLVQNLNLSAQTVSPALMQLAQGDPKWGRVRHIQAGGGYAGGGGGNFGGGGSKGGGGGGERGGLGFGAPGIISQGRASTALTSAMLANTASDNSRSGSNSSNNRSWSNNNSNQQQGPTLNLPPALQAKFQKATAVQAPSYVSSGGGAGDTGGSSAFTQSDNLSAAQAVQRALAGGGSVTNTAPAPAAPTPVTVNQDFAANPYIQGHGQGRGKHLTQPSWMAAATSSTATNTTTSNVTTAKNAAFAGVSTTAASLEPQDSPRSQFADSAVADLAGGDGATLKRKSRFSAEEPAVAVPVMAHVPTLPGFIRATATAPAAPAPTLAAAVSSSGCAAVSAAVNSGSGVGSADGGAVSSADTSISSLKPPTKKSRWDT